MAIVVRLLSSVLKLRVFLFQRPAVFISNYIQDRDRHNEDHTDILALLLRRVRKPAPKDLWAAETPEYADLERDALKKEDGWTPGMPRKKEFPIQVKVRARLFEELPEEERTLWAEKAEETKTAAPTK